MNARTRDILIRAVKTFVQAFFGVLIPALIIYLQGGWPPTWAEFWTWLAPVLAAALAAAISAVWNVLGLPKEVSVVPTEDELEQILEVQMERYDANAADLAILGADGKEAEE